jgi:hypothetical protein
MGFALGKPSHSGQIVALLGFFLALNCVGFPKTKNKKTQVIFFWSFYILFLLWLWNS